MNPITHCLTGWLVAQADTLSKRERALVTIAAIIPDVDALGLAAEYFTRNSEHPLLWWSQYHHVFAHNLGFGLFITVIAYALAKKRWLTSSLVLLSYHLHLIGDLVGSRGPDGYQWPIPYLLPFSHAWQLTWSGQWALNAWQNILITLILLAITFYLSWRRGFSPLELISSHADQAFITALRNRFK